MTLGGLGPILPLRFGDSVSPTNRTEQSAEAQSAPASFNEAQRLRFRVGCEYIDKLLREIEAILHSGEINSPFKRYIMDISPAQGRVVEDYIRRLRAQLLRALAWQGIEPSPPTIPATRSIKVHLNFVDIALADMRPRGMRGSGALSEATAAELIGILGELSSIAGDMMNYLTFDLQESLQQRVEKIAPEPEASLLHRVEEVITKRGLVEFRPRFDLLLARSEDSTFEVAVFGRVSSGKSSFLNALLGVDLLPVGVNPITAVPTRIQHGETVKSRVQIGKRPLTDVSPERLRELISEAGNPGNQEGVRRAVLAVTSPRLSAGIVLVDTPGLGSLALAGARETLAYLPSCDVALVLVDISSTLTPEDVGTLRLLQEAGIPAIVLLSKADLVKPSERGAAISYVRDQLQNQLRLSHDVYPISSLATCATMIDDLYEQALEVRFRQAHELKAVSANNKLLHLRNDIVAVLQTRVERLGSARSMDISATDDMEKKLLEASAKLGALDRAVENSVLRLSVGVPAILERTGHQLAAVAKASQRSSIDMSEVRSVAQDLVQREVAELLATIERGTQELVGIVRRVGEMLKSSELPEEGEIAGSIRDAPRFELPVFSGTVDLGIWRFLGKTVVERRVTKMVRSAAEAKLKGELSVFGSALDSWSRRILRDLRFAVDSFANVYRATLQHVEGSEDPAAEIALIRQDIALLRAEG